METVIKDLTERVAITAIARICGQVDEGFKARVRNNLHARLDGKECRHPIYDAIEAALDAASEAGFSVTEGLTDRERDSGRPTREAPAKAGAAFDPPQRGAGQEWASPISEAWHPTIDEAATKASEEYFDAADRLFAKGEPLPATERLIDAVVCSLAAIAACKGWPHSEIKDIDDAVTRIGTGRLPDQYTSLYQLLQSASSERGHDLSSAFAATMGGPESVRFGLFYDSADGSDDDARRFARDTVRIAREMADATP